jgi:uncharacterized membrane protein YoaK (UPF0700 family)/anti-anti-sigma regulatory factor
MLSAAAYSFRQKSRLAISLSWVAGYTNVILFILCAVVVSHATGNVTHLGQRLAELRLAEAWRSGGWLVLTFFCGAVASAVMTEGARRRGLASKYILPMAVQALLLCTLALLINLHGLDHHTRLSFDAEPRLLFAMSGVASFAMGLQNATITRISGSVVRTTHVTGVVTDLGLEGVQYLMWLRDKTRVRKAGRAGRVLRLSQRHPSVLRIGLLASIVGSFTFGVVVGTVAFEHWPGVAMLAPVAFLLWITFVDYRKPIADVRELDVTRDPEMTAQFGDNLKSFLPPELGIYRLTHHRKTAQHHAPDFQLWVDRLPEHWRVVILAVSPLTHFDADAAMDLCAAVQKLRGQRRDLVVCGVNRPQYKVLNAGGLTDLLGVENFAPDLDFAIARGMNLVGEIGGTTKENAKAR